MTKNLARTGLVGLAVLTSILNGSPLIVPIMGAAILALVHLATYGMDATDRALELASARRVAELTWELRTAAAAAELDRLRAQSRPLVHARAYEPNPLTPAYGLPLICGVAA